MGHTMEKCVLYNHRSQDFRTENYMVILKDDPVGYVL